MSDQPTPVQTINEYQTEPTEQPSANLHDGTNQAYDQVDQEQSLEQALEEKAEKEQPEQSEELESELSEQKDDDFSSKFAALSRREKQIREKEAALEQKMQEMEQRLEQFQAQQQQPEEPQESQEPELPLEYQLRKNPLETLEKLGIGYDKITQIALNDGKLTPDMQMDLMKQEIENKYSQKFEEIQQQLLDYQKQQEEEKYNETINNFKNELTNYINDNDSYELIRANDATDLVYDVIEQHYEETGRILSKQEAADTVESYLEEEAEKLLKLNKLRSKFGQPAATQEAAKATEQPVSEKRASIQPKAPTLSNAHSAAASKPSRPKTREESLLEAASLLKWND